MEIRELRVGNYTKEGIIRGMLDYIIFIERMSIHYINVNPIELTQEVLLSCGFENELDEIDGVPYNIYFVGDYLVEYFCKEGKYIFTDDMGIKIEIKYLHELQNVYYILNNKKELEIKLYNEN